MKNLIKISSLSLLAILALGISAATAGNCNSNNCCPKTEKKTQTQDQQQTLNLNDALNQIGATSFAQSLQGSGVDQILSQGGPYTIFAPSNTALNGLSSDTVDKLKNNPDLGKQAIENSIVQGAITKENETSQSWKSLSGQDIAITHNGQDAFVNGQKIVQGIPFQNGVIYLVDGVMLPSM